MSGVVQVTPAAGGDGLRVRGTDLGDGTASLTVDFPSGGAGTVDQGNANADPAESWWVALTDDNGVPIDATHPVPITPGAGAAFDVSDRAARALGVVTGAAGAALALDATITGGTAQAIVRGGAKGATTASTVTSTANGADHQGADVVEQFAPVYEDNTAGRALVEQRNSYANITTATTTTVKSGAGFLHRIVINKGVAAATITLYDNTAGSGTKIGTLTFGASLLTDFPCVDYDVAFSTGLTIVTSGATDITVSYR